MSRERENQSSGLLPVLVCALVAASVFGNSGCTNVGGANSAIKAASAEAMPKLPLPPVTPAQVAGTWICADSQCDADTIKVIDLQSGNIQTDFTEYLPAASPQSICHFREVSQLTLDKPVAGPFTNTISGRVTKMPFELIQDPANTHDCSTRTAQLNTNLPMDAENLLFEDDAPNELVVNGVVFRRLADEQIQAAQNSKNDRQIRSATIAGDWDCIDDGSEALKQTISGDLKSMVTESFLDFSDSQKCRIRETSSLQIRDITNPQMLYAARTKGTFTLVNDPANTAKCPDILKYLNQERLKEAQSIEQLTIERDGIDELLIQNKRFARRRVNP